MSPRTTRAHSQRSPQQKPPHSFLFPSENPLCGSDSKDGESQMEDGCEMTPRPVSWWAVKGPARAKRTGSRPAWLCWQPCFSGNSLGTGAGDSLQELELSPGLAVLVPEQLSRLVPFQRKADRLWTVSFEAGGLKYYISPLPFCLLLLFPSPLPVWWEGQGVLGREEPAFSGPSVGVGGSALTGLLRTLWLTMTWPAINTASAWRGAGRRVSPVHLQMFLFLSGSKINNRKDMTDRCVLPEWPIKAFTHVLLLSQQGGPLTPLCPNTHWGFSCHPCTSVHLFMQLVPDQNISPGQQAGGAMEQLQSNEHLKMFISNTLLDFAKLRLYYWSYCETYI